ncbi:MAG: type I glyceraldehyde-3-phosphate dehydrogenase [Synergistales bacterium]
MAKIKLGISGFGRIGRLTLRALFQHDHAGLVEIAAINHKPVPIEDLAYLFKYDSVHRTFPGKVEVDGDTIVINGSPVRVLAQPDPEKLDWKSMGVDIVIEATGKYRDKAGAGLHMKAGAKKVIITAPGKDDDCTIVMGVNEEDYDPENHHILSCASCTTNCLAPVAKVLQEEFGIEKGLMTTAHAYTSDQSILDHTHKDRRRGRSAALSIVPTTTGAAKAIGRVIPELKGKLNGIALRVPTPDVSIVDFTAVLGREASAEDINEAMKRWAEGPMKGILSIVTEELVSVDFTGNSSSSLFDPSQTMVVGNLAKVLSWYDNEWGYSCRVVDLANAIASRGL